MHVYLNKTINIKIINCGISTAGHHVATGDHGYAGQSDQRFAQLHLYFPLKDGNSVSVAFFAAHNPFTDAVNASAWDNLRSLVLCRGSAIANALSQTSMSLLLFLYIVCRGLHKATWGGEFTYMVAVHDSCFRWNSSSVFMACMGVKAVSFIFPIKVSCEKYWCCDSRVLERVLKM